MKHQRNKNRELKVANSSRFHASKFAFAISQHTKTIPILSFNQKTKKRIKIEPSPNPTTLNDTVIYRA